MLTYTDLLQAASIPEGQNELKRNQLRELAALNGTLRDDENQACQNCGEIGHRKYDCPQQRNFTANIICRVCGNAGHMARDCPDRARGQDPRSFPPRRPAGDGIDADYDNLMKEIGGGEGQDPARQIGWDAGQGGDQNGQDASNARPWQRGPTGGPAPWQNRSQGPSNPAPWNQPRQGGYDGGGYNQGPPAGGLPPWQQNQNRGGPAPWQQNGGSYGGGGGYGGQQAPWQQQQQSYNDVPPPPPPSDIPPPPPSDIPPPPPPG